MCPHSSPSNFVSFRRIAVVNNTVIFSFFPRIVKSIPTTSSRQSNSLHRCDGSIEYRPVNTGLVFLVDRVPGRVRGYCSIFEMRAIFFFLICCTALEYLAGMNEGLFLMQPRGPNRFTISFYLSMINLKDFSMSPPHSESSFILHVHNYNYGKPYLFKNPRSPDWASGSLTHSTIHNAGALLQVDFRWGRGFIYIFNMRKLTQKIWLGHFVEEAISSRLPSNLSFKKIQTGSLIQELRSHRQTQ